MRISVNTSTTAPTAASAHTQVPVPTSGRGGGGGREGGCREQPRRRAHWRERRESEGVLGSTVGWSPT